MANIDYKAAYQELINSVRKEMELWRRESEHFHEQSFEDYRAGDLDAMRASEDLHERYNGMADECKHILEDADYIVERMTYEQEQQVNENGRVSLHLIDSNTGRCVYDLDCNTSEVPARVWSEILDTVSGTVSRVSTQEDHIHEVRMNGAFGVPIWYVHLAGERYNWVNDDDKAVPGPEIWEAWYRDTAFVAF